MMAKTKAQKVAKLKRPSNPNTPWRSALRQGKTAAIGTALGQRAYYHKLGASIASCGDVDGWGNIINCRSPYCMRCGGKMIGAQQKIIATALAKYPTNQQQRDNLRHLTILFAVFPFDTSSATYPVFPTDTAIAAKKDADRMLRNFGALKRFKGMRWRGAYSWESIRDNLLTDTKRRTITALKKASTAYQPATPPKGKWQHHRILFHAHLVVDLNGLDRNAVAGYCRQHWGNNKAVNRVPDGAQLDSLFYNKPVDDSLDDLAKYPLKSKFDYNDDNNTTLEPDVLAALCDGLTQLNRRGSNGVILSQHGWP